MNMAVIYLDEVEIETESETERQFVRIPKRTRRKMTYEEKCRRYGWNPKDDIHV